MVKRTDATFLDDIRRSLYTAVLSDVLDELGLRNQAMTPRVRPLDESQVLVGFARTGLYREVFHVAPGENPYELEIKLIDDLKPGDVAVLCCGGSRRIAPWGELLSTAARARGAAGAVMDGFVRDIRHIRTMGFPTFHAGIAPLDSKGRGKVADIDVPVECDGVYIEPGDLMHGDADGVIVIPRRAEDEVLSKAFAKVRDETATRSELERGVKLAEVFERFGVL